MIKTHINTTDKFKTVSIVLKFKAPLKKETITERALLSKMLTKVSADYPTEQLMHDKSADLYGANIFSYVTKQKNAHIITLGIDMINEKYVTEDLLEEGMAFLESIIKRPLVKEEAFNAHKLELEKQLLTAKLEAMKDNKTQYGFQQMMYEMFRGMDYQYPSYGIMSDISRIDGTVLYKAYRSMIEDDEKEIFVIGDVDKNIETSLQTHFNFDSHPAQIAPFVLPKQEVQHVTETIETTQGKINMGFTIDITFGSPEYYAFIVFNQIYGGDVTSLLFTNVREKLSLAYQVHSQADSRAGLLYVVAGVKSAAREQAVETILKELDNIRNGAFDDTLIATAKTMLIAHKKESFDRPRGWIESTYAQSFNDKKVTTDEWIQGILDVNKMDVERIAKRLELRTIYCLAGENE